MPGSFSLEAALLLAGLFLIIGVLASKASAKLGVPALLLFIGIGMLAGSDGPGGIQFDDVGLTKAIGTIALGFILFAGGLDTQWSDIRPILWRGLALSTVGVAITIILIGWFACNFLGFSLFEGFLLASVVSSTDAAAIFNVLRARNIVLKHKYASLLEFESGTNDPIAVFLTLGMIGLIKQPESSLLGLIPNLLAQMSIGFVLGYFGAIGTVWFINRLRLEYDGLYPVITLALLFLTFGGAHFLRGNEFLAVYVAGLTMGRHNFLHKMSLVQFHDGLAWLMQMVMFLALGLLVYPSQLVSVIGTGLILSLFLMVVARPLSVFLALLPFKMDFNSKLFVSWAGLRGAVPIILATFPLLAGTPKAGLIFNLVFFVVLTSVLVQGTTLVKVANWLKLIPQTRDQADNLTPAKHSDLLEIVLSRGSPAVGKQVIELNLPRTALLVLLKRDGESYVPKGATILQTGDTLLIATRKEDQEELRVLFEDV